MTDSPSPFDHRRFTQIRHQLHAHPELSGQEKTTAAQISQLLAPYKPDQTEVGLGGHGLYALFSAPLPGPRLLFRAELDGLPISENPGKSYASQFPNRSHLCGHDGHMTILLALAAKLRITPPRRGSVVLLFQPAEETGMGAQLLLDEPKIRDLQPDQVYALHNLPGYPLHQVVLRTGTFAAASTGLLIELEGSTAHAAEPDKGRSPVQAVAKLLDLLPKIPSSHADFGLLTVVHCKIGDRNFGISPGKAEIACTLRAFDQKHFEKLLSEVKSEVTRMAELHHISIRISLKEQFAAVQNSQALIGRIDGAAKALNYSTTIAEAPFKWSEDFGLFTQKYPGALFGLGAGETCAALHHPDYDFPDDLIETGSSLFMQIIRKELM